MSDAGLNEQRQNSDCAPGYSESNQEGPKTVSHSLAIAAHGDKGTAQQEHDQDVRDLGWNAPLEHIPAPLVGGLSNEYLWMLVRRFNKVDWPCFETALPLLLNMFTANISCERGQNISARRS